MLKTTTSQVLKSANRDITDMMKRARQYKTVLANAKPDMTLLINVLRPVMQGSDYISVIMGYEKPQIVVHANGLDSFKTGRIVQILQVLEAFGTCRNTKDWASMINRDYKYDMPKFEVLFCAYVKEDSPTCRKIEVGTEVQTVIKYEIQCD